MSKPTEQPVSPRSHRRLIRALSVIFAVLILLAVAGAVKREHLAYNKDICTCYSDNMWTLRTGLERYVEEHDGETPTTFDELRTYMESKLGDTYDICVKADKPFIWMPPDVKTDDGRPVILMCPPDSHGWLRKYAFGLVRMRDGDEFRFVRVRGNRATPFRW